MPLLHPFIPFVTEELWAAFGFNDDYIMRSSWPVAVNEYIFDGAVEDMAVEDMVGEDMAAVDKDMVVEDMDMVVGDMDKVADHMVVGDKDLVVVRLVET